MALSATVFTPRTTQANLTQANTSQVVRVTVPGPAGPSGAAAGALNDLSDVDITSPVVGSLLQYNSSSEKWTDQTDISDLGTITINGGNF